MKIRDYVRGLVSKGRWFFSEKEALKATGVSRQALRSALRRLKKKGEIKALIRGFYCYVPPEYDSIGSLPPEQFIHDLMQHLKLSYYIGLLSAAQYYGATHQQPQIFQVIVEHPRREILLGRIRVSFISKKNVNEMPIRQFNTSKGYVKVASQEVLAIDLVCYPHHSGGIAQVFNVLSEFSEQLKLEEFIKLIKKIGKAKLLQRMGYFFELLDLKEMADACENELKHFHYLRKTLLDPQSKSIVKSYSSRWKLIINADLEIENDS